MANDCLTDQQAQSSTDTHYIYNHSPGSSPGQKNRRVRPVKAPVRAIN
nr:MAG TPA: hypothetical protein [Caudoviricetes sp.]